LTTRVSRLGILASITWWCAPTNVTRTLSRTAGRPPVTGNRSVLDVSRRSLMETVSGMRRAYRPWPSHGRQRIGHESRLSALFAPRGSGRTACGRSSRRHPKRLIFGWCSATGDLLRRPVVPELPVHDAAQARVRGELTRLGAQRSTPGPSIRGFRSVWTRATVASHFTTDRRGCPTEAAGDLAQRVTVHQTAGDLLPLGQCQ
jgi:hypothetical protein